jgi:hypothetical protein
MLRFIQVILNLIFIVSLLEFLSLRLEIDCWWKERKTDCRKKILPDRVLEIFGY